MVKRLSQKEFMKLHDRTIKQVLKYTTHLIDEGIKSTSWTLTNDFKVTFRDLKRKPRSKK